MSKHMLGKHAIAYMAVTKCKTKAPFKMGDTLFEEIEPHLTRTQTHRTQIAPCTAVKCSVTEPIVILGKGQCTNSIPAFSKKDLAHPKLPGSSFSIPFQKQGFFCRRNTGNSQLCPNTKVLISSMFPGFQESRWCPGFRTRYPPAGIELIFSKQLL